MLACVNMLHDSGKIPVMLLLLTSIKVNCNTNLYSHNLRRFMPYGQIQHQDVGNVSTVAQPCRLQG